MKVFHDENPKKRFLDMNKLQKATQIKKIVPQQQFPEWFSMTTIDPICFMNVLWLISANWCLQKLLFPEWLLGGLIHLNLRTSTSSSDKKFQLSTVQNTGNGTNKVNVTSSLGGLVNADIGWQRGERGCGKCWHHWQKCLQMGKNVCVFFKLVLTY